MYFDFQIVGTLSVIITDQIWMIWRFISFTGYLKKIYQTHCTLFINNYSIRRIYVPKSDQELIILLTSYYHNLYILI